MRTRRAKLLALVFSVSLLPAACGGGGPQRTQFVTVIDTPIVTLDPLDGLTPLATDGVPQAIDSSSTLGTPSERLGRTVTSAALNHAGNWRCAIGPRNFTNGSSPAS